MNENSFPIDDTFAPADIDHTCDKTDNEALLEKVEFGSQSITSKSFDSIPTTLSLSFENLLWSLTYDSSDGPVPVAFASKNNMLSQRYKSTITEKIKKHQLGQNKRAKTPDPQPVFHVQNSPSITMTTELTATSTIGSHHISSFTGFSLMEYSEHVSTADSVIECLTPLSKSSVINKSLFVNGIAVSEAHETVLPYGEFLEYFSRNTEDNTMSWMKYETVICSFAVLVTVSSISLYLYNIGKSGIMQKLAWIDCKVFNSYFQKMGQSMAKRSAKKNKVKDKNVTKTAIANSQSDEALINDEKNNTDNLQRPAAGASAATPAERQARRSFGGSKGNKSKGKKKSQKQNTSVEEADITTMAIDVDLLPIHKN